MAGLDKRIEALEKSLAATGDPEASTRRREELAAKFERLLEVWSARIEEGGFELAELRGQSPVTIAAVAVCLGYYDDLREVEAREMLAEVKARRGLTGRGLEKLADHYAEELGRARRGA